MEYIIYLLKVNIAILLFYGLYRLFFQKDTFFQGKRILLLSLIFMSLLYPFVKISGLFLLDKITSENFILPVGETSEKANYWIFNLQEIIINNDSQSEQTNSGFLPVVAGIYSIGVILLSIRFLIQLGSLLLTLFQTKKSNYKGQTIRVKKGIQAPFSFFDRIVLDPDQHTESELDEILRHETTHIRQFHSLDVLLSELLSILCWFNPLVWLMKREIRMNLEYLADRSVISSGFDSEHYQFHLLRLCHYKAAAKLSNNFNVSPLKSRITMMNKKETSLWNIAKYALFVPLALSLTVFNSYAGNPDIQTQTGNKTEDTASSFPGGKEALSKWLMEKINYPVIAIEKGIEKRVIARFVIEPDGSIDQIEIINPESTSNENTIEITCVGYGQKVSGAVDEDSILDKNVIRLIKSMPKWNPGTKNNNPVSTYQTISINFRIADK